MKSAFRICSGAVCRLSSVLAVIMMTMSLSSCDFCRRLAGRPDSSEIERLRVAKRQDELSRQAAAAEAARADSVRAVLAAAAVKVERDSLTAMEELASKSVKMIPVSNYGIVKDTKLPYRYYIITGSYRMLPNAERQARDCRSAGYETVLISLKTGYNLVAVSPSDRIADIAASRVRVSKENFCPDNSWILVNE